MTYENLTSFTEVDPSNEYSETATRCSWIMIGQAHKYVYKDYTAGYFGDFKHCIDIYIDTADGDDATSTYQGVWALVNDVTTPPTIVQNCLSLWVYNYFGITLNLRDRFNWGNTGDAGTISLDTPYYLVIERAGTTLTCEIYSDSARTALVDTLSVACQATTFRYLECAWGVDTDSNHSGVGYSEKFNISCGDVSLPMGLGLSPLPKGGVGRPALLTGGSSFGG